MKHLFIDSLMTIQLYWLRLVVARWALALLRFDADFRRVLLGACVCFTRPVLDRGAGSDHHRKAPKSIKRVATPVPTVLDLLTMTAAEGCKQTSVELPIPRVGAQPSAQQCASASLSVKERWRSPRGHVFNQPPVVGDRTVSVRGVWRE